MEILKRDIPTNEEHAVGPALVGRVIEKLYYSENGLGYRTGTVIRFLFIHESSFRLICVSLATTKKLSFMKSRTRHRVQESIRWMNLTKTKGKSFALKGSMKIC